MSPVFLWVGFFVFVAVHTVCYGKYYNAKNTGKATSLSNFNYILLNLDIQIWQVKIAKFGISNCQIWISKFGKLRSFSIVCLAL